MKRYFMVSYVHQDSYGYGYGQINVTSEGSYLNNETTMEQISSLTNKNNIVIMNIIEFNENDYNDWKDTK